MKKIIRLTESDLHRLVKESVKRIIRESETTDADIYWSESDVIRLNTHDATYYPDDNYVEFDVSDAVDGVPFVIEPYLDLSSFEDWDPNMIEDIGWSYDYYAPADVKSRYERYEDNINAFMKANKNEYLEKVRDGFETP